MRRLKFWQKTYLAILALFLACVLGVVLSVYTLGQRQGFDAAVGEALSANRFFTEALAQDIATLQVRRPAALAPLYDYYNARYATQESGFEIFENGKAIYSCLPKGATPLGHRPELAIKSGQQCHLVREMQSTRYLYIGTALPAPLAGTHIVYVTSLAGFYRQWETIRFLLFIISGAVCVVFALALYFVLSGMYKPLWAVTKTAQSLAHGTLSARANERRKDEFGELAKSLNAMATTVERQISALQASGDEKQHMLDNLAHELRTPLAAITGWAETLRGANLTAQEQFEAADTILFEANRALTLSQQLLRLSALRGEDGVLVPVPVGAAFARASHAILPKAEGCGVRLTVLPPHEPCAILADEALLESLLCNLLDNAVKACEGGGEVTLYAEQQGETVALFVADTGRGMSAETLQNLGKPFYRADKARSRAEGGAGLGLSICFAIAAHLGAVLRFTSAVGKGTNVCITFTSPTHLADNADICTV